MPLRLITGPANAGKTKLLIDELCQHAAGRQPALLLVPSAPDVSRALGWLSERAPLGVGVRTFDAFLDDLWERHGDGRVIATPVQRLAVLEESGNAWKPQWLTPPALTPGAVTVLERLVQRAAESAIPIEPAAVPAGYARDLAVFAASYSSTLRAAGLIERAEAHRLVAESAEAIAVPSLVACDGFTGLTPAQEAFIRRVSTRSDVLLALTYSPEAPATSAARPLVERLLVQAKEVRLGPPAGERPAELERLARRLGTAGDAEVTASGAVVLSEAWGRDAEAARIVREVQEAISVGIEPASIAVVFRDAASHLREMRAAFADAGIPMAADVQLSYSGIPFGRALLLALRVVSLSHNALLDLLRSPYSPASAEVLDAYDAHARGSRETGLGSALRWFGRHERDTADFLHQLRRALSARAVDEAERRWYAIVSEMLARAAGSADLYADAAAARVFMDALRGLCEAGRKEISPDTLFAVLRRATVTLDEEAANDAVRLLGAERARGASYRCLIVGGLNAGEFPRTSREDALADPTLAAAFSRARIDLASRVGHDEERLLFYQLVTRASERLVLSRQSHGEEGQPLRGSIFLDEVLDLYRDPVSLEYYAGEPPVRRLGLDGVAMGVEAPVSERRTMRSEALSPEPGACGRLREARRRARPRPSGISEQVRRHMADRECFSASELETYLQCPYRWAIQRLVQPRELDERVDQAAMGLLGHEILHRFYQILPERTGARRVTGAVLGEARELHAEVAIGCLSRIAPSGVMEAMSCRTVVRQTLGLIEADSWMLPGFEPVHHEWTFGGDGDAGEDFGDFSLLGRVDRIDSDGARLVLTDYKSGRIGPEHGVAKFEVEGTLQLPLYAAVAQRRLGGSVAAVLYRSFRGGKPRGMVRADVAADGSFVSTDVLPDATAVEAEIRVAIERARGAIERMRTGDIAAEPRSGACPPYCPATGFCAGWRPGRA